MDRARLRLPLLVVAAVLAAEGAVLVLRPREGIVDPAPVSARSYFSAAEMERARDFRRPQLALAGAVLALQGGVLVLLLARPPRRLPRRAAAAGVVVSLALTAVALPVQAVMRQRSIDVGLSTQPWSGWAGDVARSAGIGAVFAGGGAALAVGLGRRFGRRWWAPGSVVLVAAGAAMLYAGPVVLDPLFNRFAPLPDGPVRRDVLTLADRAGVRIGRVLEVDASRRTSAANAYVTGLGPTKRVVLYDTLTGSFTREETRLVVAHELAHVRHRDLPRGLLFLALVAPLGLLAVARLSETWTGDDARRRVPALALALGVVSTPVTLASNQLSRAVEARADAYALRLTGDARAFVDFERRITVRNVSDPDPPAWTSFLLGTHPSAVRRIGTAIALSPAAGEGRRRTPGGS